MTELSLLNRGYFPKELPPCFFTERLGADIAGIRGAYNANEATAQATFVNKVIGTGLTPSQLNDERSRFKQIFKNRLYFSECGQFSIPKFGVARNLIKIPNPLHQARLTETIISNYNDIKLCYVKSSFSTSKPEIEIEVGEGKRSLVHSDYGYFKQICLTNSFKYSIQLTTDISKFYPSIYTHTVPWITFGGKSKYKRNRDLHEKDPNRNNSIYGDKIDSALMWCQNQQTMGIPIGPDTSLIVAELIGCHIDELLDEKLKKKSIDFIAYRYYDDYAMYFNSEVDARIALNDLKSILHDFELKINDDKTKITQTLNELESEWALALKSFYFRPSEANQKDDLWNFFSLAFRYAGEFPNANVLKLAINKFNYVRIEKHNWEIFESLIYRLGLVEPATLQKVAKLLISYRSLVDRKKLKVFCCELIERNFENRNDYELTWSAWLMREFDVRPTKKILIKILESQSVTASLIALEMLSLNTRIKFDYSLLKTRFTTESLNTRDWLLTYESVHKGWIPSFGTAVITDHFYFDILHQRDVYFYDSSRKLEPLKTHRSALEKIDNKVTQILKYLSKNKLTRSSIEKDISAILNKLTIGAMAALEDRKEVYKQLAEAETNINLLTEKIKLVQAGLTEFRVKKPYFVIQQRLAELFNLTTKEIASETKQDKELLFDPKYK